MQKIVSPAQASFIPGRQIVDNIIVAQEVLHKFRNSKGKKGFIAWKIDLSKAYDRINWDFIYDVLWEIGIRGKLLVLIMQCIKSVRYQAILNGELTGRFSPNAGIRQGNPLSPYIFVLCMEKHSHIIIEHISSGTWKPVMVARNGPAISHLFFADDLILFREASIHQAKLMKHCLDLFCGASGQQVSFEKSRICCSPNTEPGITASIANICGSPLTDCLGNYLGVPLIQLELPRILTLGLLTKCSAD
ncbi:transposable element gene [Prunus dulcis]|uniref:Transposable element protein n=1 Tax=Prunus dulcis TaxID=3755 RepID=A0A4Y1RJU9_PRUDU|nr:transposable element gene [Prunus dulcis]